MYTMRISKYKIIRNRSIATSPETEKKFRVKCRARTGKSMMQSQSYNAKERNMSLQIAKCITYLIQENQIKSKRYTN